MTRELKLDPSLIALTLNSWLTSLITKISESLTLINISLGDSACDDPYGLVKTATGFAIDKNIVVTVAHIEPSKYVCLADVSGQRFKGKVLSIDNRWDLAFIESEKNLNPLRISFDQPPIGSLVIVGGMPYGLLRPFFTTGIVSGYKVNSIIDGKSLEGLMMLSAPTTPGMSGGPVVGVNEEVVGMVVASAMNVNEFALAVPIKRVRFSYNILRKTGKITHLSLGIRVVEGMSRGIKGVTVSSIINTRLHEVCGIDVGDTITSIDGYTIEGLEDLWDRLDEAVLNSSQFIELRFFDYSEKMFKECSYPIIV
ncbi:MAG: S1C family serine protease [Ignisphaera sp.]